jgi:hypothetical protein
LKELGFFFSNNMATGSAVSKFSHLFGRRSAVVIGMIHVEALPGILKPDEIY